MNAQYGVFPNCENGVAREPKIMASILPQQNGSIVGTRKTVGLDRRSTEVRAQGLALRVATRFQVCVGWWTVLSLL